MDFSLDFNFSAVHAHLFTHISTHSGWSSSRGSLTKLRQKCSTRKKRLFGLTVCQEWKYYTCTKICLMRKKMSPLQNCLLKKHLQFAGVFLTEDNEDGTVQNWDVYYEERGQCAQSSCWKTLFPVIGFSWCPEIIITQVDVFGVLFSFSARNR